MKNSKKNRQILLEKKEKNAINTYRFKEILKYKNENDELNDSDLTIKYDIVKNEEKYKNFYETWIEKNIGNENKKSIEKKELRIKK